MRAYELYENTNKVLLLEFLYDGGGWLNVKTRKFVSTKYAYHTLSIFQNMEKFNLTIDKMRDIPAFAKWLDAGLEYNDLDVEDDIPKVNGQNLDGDMEIINWMNDNGWVRTIKHKDFGRMEVALQGNNITQIHRAAKIIDRADPIEALVFDVNDLSKSMTIDDEKLKHFLRYGNINFNIRAY